MNIISDINKLSVAKEQLCYEGKKIGNWFTKTLYRIDPETKNLQYHNFSIFGLFLHLFGYKKEYTSQNLPEWLKEKITIKLPADGKVTEKVAIEALKIFQKENHDKLSTKAVKGKADPAAEKEELVIHSKAKDEVPVPEKSDPAAEVEELVIRAKAEDEVPAPKKADPAADAEELVIHAKTKDEVPAQAQPPADPETKRSEAPVPAQSVPSAAPEKIERTILPEPLLSDGKVRKGTEGHFIEQTKRFGEGPRKMADGTISYLLSISDPVEDMTANFAISFHTDESLNEILKLLTDIYKKVPITLFEEPKEKLSPPVISNLHTNFVNLHLALPGKELQKEAKIYWNEQALRVLIPHFFKEAKQVDINDLVFATIQGETSQSPFQAEKMCDDQLQFAGIGKQVIFAEIARQIEEASKKLPEEAVKTIKAKIPQKQYDNPLMKDASHYAYQRELLKQLNAGRS